MELKFFLQCPVCEKTIINDIPELKNIEIEDDGTIKCPHCETKLEVGFGIVDLKNKIFVFPSEDLIK
jgi:DNA-directed RNA polymerase subunit RPC12/RpoP